MSWFGKSNKTQQIESDTSTPIVTDAGTTTNNPAFVVRDTVTGTAISDTSPFYTSVVHYASQAFDMELISNINDKLTELGMDFEELYNLLHELKEEQK